MRYRFFNFLVLLFLYVAMGNSYAQSSRGCGIYGKIYVEKQEGFAQFLVYKEDSEAFADLIVYEEDSRLFADEEGKWFFVKNRNFADYRIAFTDNKNKAHFSIFISDEPSDAACNN